MTKAIFFLSVVFNNFAFAQTDSLPELLIQYSVDKTITLFGYKNSKLNFKNDTAIINQSIPIDTIINYYNFEIDFILDTLSFNFFKYHLVLDSTAFSELLHKSKLIIPFRKEGYCGIENHDLLQNKYGAGFSTLGCTYTPDKIIECERKYCMRLLGIRNGINWENQYYDEKAATLPREQNNTNPISKQKAATKHKKQ